jgi:hypothetical protein
MTKTAVLLALAVTALASMPAHAQTRVFVASFGLDTNPCNVAQPCRTFQHAHDTAPANSEIEVVDPAGYGPVTITKGISIQGHGFGGIFQGASDGYAITINVTAGDPVTLNGLLIDGGGTGYGGIQMPSGASVQILNSIFRHFQLGIGFGTIGSNNTNMLIEDTIVSDNSDTGILLDNNFAINAKATLNRITANNNRRGVTTGVTTTIANSVMSNNSQWGVATRVGVTWLAKSVISGNGTGVNNLGGTMNSYGDNYINNNTTPVMGSLTPVGMQ